MKAVRLEAPGRPVLIDLPTPEVGPGEVLIRTRLVGICGGEVVPWYVARKTPFVPGHEPVGVVEAVGEGVAGLSLGQRVFFHHHVACGKCPACLRGEPVHCPAWKPNRLDPGGQAELVRLEAAGRAGVVPLPDALSDEAGVLVEPLACCVKTFRRAALAPGERLLVLGLGLQGILHAHLAHALGAEAHGVDPDPARAKIARARGIEVVEDPAENAYDVAVVGAPNAAALGAAFRAVRPAGRVVLFAPFPPEEPPSVPSGPFFFDEISFLASYSCGEAEVAEAVARLARGEFPYEGLVTDRFAPEEAAAAFAAAAAGGETLKVVIAWS